jgi:hypothetical protein
MLKLEGDVEMLAPSTPSDSKVIAGERRYG